MARGTSNTWRDLDERRLADLDADKFEGLCAALVRCEAYDRHDDPQIDAGAGKDVADGGRDLLLTLTRPPTETKLEYQRRHGLTPLTEDPLPNGPRTRIAYSFKSGNGWFDDALDDARKRAKRAVEVLREGGYFKLFISRPGKLDNTVKRGRKGEQAEATPHEHLTRVFWERLKAVDPDASDPGPRIRILDAGDLATFLRARQPEGDNVLRWAESLGISPVLRPLAEWRKLHVEDRAEPAFAEDAVRATLRQQLLALLGAAPDRPDDRIACIVGKPGVGKTRLVLEMLSSAEKIGQRAQVAFSPIEAGDAIDEHRLLRSNPDVVLVVDDCLVEEAHAIAARFRAAVRDDSHARLILLVPASLDSVQAELRIKNTWGLGPLDAEHAQKIVATEIRRPETDADVVGLARFSEGFPWFARLLAIEFMAEGRAPADMREAVLWALASGRETRSPQERSELQHRRARCLLAASLTRAVDWDRLSHERRERLAHAVGLRDWRELSEGAWECVRRGLLRRSLDWQFKYVTPQVLEREVIAWLLGPDGPDRGGRRLSHFASEYLDDFFNTLIRLNLPRGVIAVIADTALSDLRAAPLDLCEIRAAGISVSRLLFLARHRPAETASELRRRLEATRTEELREYTNLYRGLVSCLEALSSRRDAFEDAESALFRLARAEMETHGSSTAAMVWSSLFLVELNITYRSLAARLRVLESRLSSTLSAERRVALGGLKEIITAHPLRMWREQLDGPWPLPSAGEGRQARLHAWELLRVKFSDRAEEVASAAKKLAVDHLRDAVRLGIGAEVLKDFALELHRFSDDERLVLRTKLEEIRSYDLDFLRAGLDYLTHLEHLAAPQTFHERLRQRVGVWGPASLKGQDEQLDDELAREGVGDGVPMLAEVPWLLSRQAQRAHVFAYALGRNDGSGVLLEELRRLARENRTSWLAQAVLARYIGGMAQAVGQERAREILHSMQANDEEVEAAALVLVEIPVTGQDIRWLEATLPSQRLQVTTVLEFARRIHGWLTSANDEDFLGLVTALLGGEPVEYAAAALEMMLERATRVPGAGKSLRNELLCALERLAPTSGHGMSDYDWERGAALLVNLGEAARVAVLAVTALQRGRGSNDFAWNALHLAAERDASSAFKAVARALERDESANGSLLAAFWYHRQSFAWPVEELLAWVGDDEHRGRIAAGVVRAHDGDELPAALRGLIRRFGPGSSVASAIESRIISTDGAVASIAGHDREQLSRARAWIDDPEPSIAAFARELVGKLERSYEYHAAYEEEERRRFGT